MTKGIGIDMAPILSHRVFTLGSAYVGTPSIKEAWCVVHTSHGTGHEESD